jgi:aryl-alcohol dehydrogenase-like predicted oxidoreductase
MTIQMRSLGRTGVQLSAIGFGCMGSVGWYGERNDVEARATLLEAIDRGVNHFDTAASYQGGENERFLGAAIKGRRDRVFIATKYGITRRADGTLVIDNRPASLQQACESSLERLDVEHIDLFYLHRIDRSVPVEESVGALSKLIVAGKIRHIGLSECSVATLRRAHAVHPIAAVQNEYSLWTRDPEAAILPACRELGVSLVAYSPLGRGFLAGNFRDLSELPKDDNRQSQPRFQQANVEHNLKIAQQVRAFAQRKGCTPAQLAIAWLLAQGEDVLPIPGTKQRTRLAENLSALDVSLTHAEIDDLNRSIAQLSVRGDRYPPPMMQVLEG